MLGNLGPDYKKEELRQIAAAEAAALANINPDGGYRNYPSNYSKTEAEVFRQTKQYQENIQGIKNVNQWVRQVGQSVGQVVNPVAEALSLDTPLAAAGLMYDATIGNLARAGEQALIDRGVHSERAKLGVGLVETVADLMIGSRGARAASKAIRPVRIREIPQGRLPPGRVPRLPPGEIGAVFPPSGNSSLTIRGRLRRPSPKQIKLIETTSQDLGGLSSDAKLKWNIAAILARNYASPRNTGGIIQASSDSQLLQELANINTAEDVVRIQKNYFSRHPLYKGAPGSELDHTNPVGRVTDILIGQKPSTIEETLRIMKEEHGLVFSDDGMVSSLPKFTHSMKHSGDPTVIDWSSPWAKSIVEKVPKNATTKELETALLELHEKSLEMTGRAIQTQNFESFRNMVMDILPGNIRKQLGEDFDITGRTASKEDWDLFRLSMKDANERLKEIIRRTGQKIPTQQEVDLLNSDRYNPYR